MRIISTEFLEANRTERGSWTRAQLAQLGIPWPPMHGWRALIVGTEISDEAAARFVAFKTRTARVVRQDEFIARLAAQAKAQPEAVVAPPQTDRLVTRKERRRLAKVRRKQEKQAAKVARLQAKLANKNNWSNAPQYNGDVARNEFLESFAWRQLRMRAIQKYGPRCMCCGASRDTGAVIHVDHIKPRRLFPQLALDIDNLQILCHECNHGKGNWDQTDWREHVDPEVAAMLRDIAKEEPR